MSDLDDWLDHWSMDKLVKTRLSLLKEINSDINLVNEIQLAIARKGKTPLRKILDKEKADGTGVES
jgi:hypothetical protein